MTTFCLPERPDLTQLRRQARELLTRLRTGDADALAELRAHHPRPPDAPQLADAQLALARAYGATSWPDLVAQMEEIRRHGRAPHRVEPATDPAAELLRLACLRYGGDDRADQQRARTLLSDTPGLGAATPYTAAAAGDVAALTRNLDTDPDAVEATGGPFDWPPLLYLAYSRLGTGDPVGSARLLLERGADPDAGYLWEGNYPFTALTGVFGCGEEGAEQPPHPRAGELARLLLEAGADPNDSQVLYNRAVTPADDHLRLLIEFGLGRGDGGPWHRRIRDRHGTPAQLLEDQLAVAAEHDRPGWARLALAAGADPDGRGTRHPVYRGLTPYELAVTRGNREVAAMLAAAGATVPAQDAAGEFLAAALAGEPTAGTPADVVATAIARRPDAVLDAVGAGRAAAVIELAGHGFAVDRLMTPAAGPVRTPLHQAALVGDGELVALLLELGADPHVRDPQFDAAPRGWAEHGGHDEVAALLPQ